MERATALILEIAGGSAGPTQVTQAAGAFAQRARSVRCGARSSKRLLGAAIDAGASG